MGRLLALLALVAMPSAWAQPVADRVDGAIPDEVEAFRQARERFTDRMRELNGDTHRYVDFREAEETEKLIGGYDALISRMELRDSDQRDLAILRFDTFLTKYPDLDYADHIRFRLADLYFEQATEDWISQYLDYENKLDNESTPIEVLEALVEPQRDLSKALALYLKIIEGNKSLPTEQQYEKLDGTYVMLGFVYNDENSIQYDPALAKQAFSDLILFVPGSELADRSHLFMGNFAFADSSFDEAIAEYRLVYEKGEASPYFMEAIYQLAWGQYKLNEFDESLSLFTELLDRSEQKVIDSGRESAFAPDAKRFMAFSFADIALDNDTDALPIAKRYFEGIGPRDYERDVYIQLADVLIRYTRPEEAISVYQTLQDDPRWVNHRDNPVYQAKVVDLYSQSIARDLEMSGEERLEYITRYNEGGDWWQVNRSDPEALEVARRYIEGSLLDVAIEYRVRAQESGSVDDYRLAAAKYAEYLDKFPISDDYYKNQWFLADSLKLAGEYDEALEEFESLRRSRRSHDYGDAALYSVMDLRYQAMVARGHEADKGPTDAPVERTTGEGDKKVDVYGFTPDRMAFMEAARDVLSHTFVAVESEDLPDYAKEVGQRRPRLLYLIGQIAHYHNRFYESRPQFEALIADYPQSIEANYAAGLLVDSYLTEGDLAQVRSLTKRFTLNPPGPTTDIDPERFKDTLEGSTFKLALEIAESGEAIAAAEAFVEFRREFPGSEFDSDALFNAAYYYQQSGKVEKSNSLYEQYVVAYPDDDKTKGLLFRIAANYEAAFQLDDAVEYYRRVLTHPGATQTEKGDAQYNASFLLIGLGRHREAAQGFESYNDSYPEQPDVEEVYFAAGEQWQQADPDEAIKFYKNRYQAAYPDESADHFIESEYRLLKLYEQTGAEDWRIRNQGKAILEAFDRFARSGKDIGANGHRYAAAADFPRLEGLFDDYSDDALSGNDDRDQKLLTETKPADLKEFEGELDGFVAKYKNFEYNSGALFLKARAALYLADLGLSIKCPKKLVEEQCWAFEEILDEKVFPQYYGIEDVGVKRLEELVGAARSQKKHSRFIDDAQAELNRRRPNDHAAVKQELEGGTDSTIPVEVKPKRPGAPAKPPPALATEPTEPAPAEPGPTDGGEETP